MKPQTDPYGEKPTVLGKASVERHVIDDEMWLTLES